MAKSRLKRIRDTSRNVKPLDVYSINNCKSRIFCIILLAKTPQNRMSIRLLSTPMVFHLIAMVTPFMSVGANVSTVYVFLLPLAFLLLQKVNLFTSCGKSFAL